MPSGLVDVVAALNPVSTTVERTTAPEGWTLLEIIEAVDPALLSSENVVVLVDDLLIPHEQWMSTTPEAGETVIVRVVPTGGGGAESDKVLRSVLFIGITALSVYAAGAGYALLGASIAVGGVFAVDALVPPPTLQIDTPTGAADATTRTPALSGARNALNPYGPVPLVLGRHRITPPLGAQPYTELDQSDQFLRMLMIVGYGPLEISDMRIGETLLTDYDDVQVEAREGESGDDAIEIFPSTVVEDSVGVLLKQTTGWVTRRTETSCDEIGVEVTFPQGLVQLNADGTRSQRTVELDAEYKLVGNGGWKEMGDAHEVPSQVFGAEAFPGYDKSVRVVIDKRSGRITIVHSRSWDGVPTTPSDKFTIARVRKTWVGTLTITDERDPALTAYGAGNFLATNAPDTSHVTVAAGKFDCTPLSRTERKASTIRVGKVVRVARGQYDVRVKRVTADSASDLILDEAYWTVMRSITNEDPVSLDGVAKVALRIRATDQLQGVISEFNCVAHSVMPDWDSATSAWVTRPTSNPASIFRHLLQGPMNKRPVADARIDLPALQTWHEWCESNGHEFNGVVNFSTTLLRLLRDVASVGRASPTMRDGLFSVVQDVARSTPRQLFTPKNSWGFSAQRSFADLPHALKVQYIRGLPTHKLTATPANVEVGDVFTLKNGDTVLATFTATAATVANVVTGLKAAWDASSERITELYDATDDATHLSLDGNRPSAQYEIAGVATNGGAADTQTLTMTTQSDEGTWERDEIIVYDDGYALVAGGGDEEATKFEQVDLFGVANPDQAWKTGRYMIAAARLRPETYVINTDVEHIVCNRGDLVRVQHDVPLFGLSSGRVTARTVNGANVDDITLDETVTMVAATDYAVRYRQSDNTVRVEDITLNVGQQTTLAFAAPPLIADAPDIGDLVSFGIKNSETVEMIVHQIEMGEELTAKITLVDAAPAVHTADSGTIPAYDPQITVAPRVEELVPAVPEIVSLRSDSDVMVKHKDGTYENRILATIRAGSGGSVPAARFQAQFKLSDATTWIELPDAPADATEFSVIPVQDGEAYDFRVRAVSEWNVTSAWASSEDYTTLGAMDLGTDFLSVYDAALGLSAGEKGNGVIENGVLFTPVDTEETWAEHFSSRSWADIQDQIDAGYPYYAQPTKPSGGQSNELPDAAESGLAGAWLNAGVQGSAADWSRAGDDMTAIGGPTYRDVAGVTLDGATEYLRRAEAGWNADEVGSITAMVRTDAVGAAHTIFATSDEASDVRYLKLSINVAGYLEISQSNNDVADVVRGSTVLAADTWYHVACVCTTTGWVLYVNGVAETLTVTAGANSGDWLADTADRDNVTIGALRKTAVSEYWDGDVKDVRYYSARSLTAAQIALLSTGGRGAWETEIDLAGTVYFSKIKTSITLDKVDGIVTATPSLSISSNGTYWTDYVGSAEINVTGYRYVRVRWDFVADDDLSYIGVSSIRLEIDAKTRIDSALATLAAGDATGTEITLGLDFLSVNAIAATPKGTVANMCEVNFDFAQDNPTTFKVLMFDKDGIRASGDATYVARGY